MPNSESDYTLFRPFLLLVLGLIFILLPAYHTQAQVYLLNEDFSSASNSTPPPAWSNFNQAGSSESGLWQFDNPTQLLLNYPVSGKAAVFDTKMMAAGAGPERVSLESPSIDCSINANILLFFNHHLDVGQSGKGVLEVYNGQTWGLQSEFTASTSGTVQEIINISAIAGARSNVKLRFSWEGDTTGFWIIDNIKILVPSPRDLNLFSFDSPKMPFEAGIQPVKISLFNQGIETINSVNIQWNVNGIQQVPFNWSGQLLFGEKIENLEIGSYVFPIGGIRTFRIWINDPNNSNDYNHLNDTITTRLGGALCGNYTIGGENPDFTNFTDATFALNNASISCPVVFKVRPGIYSEQVNLRKILGSSLQNTITFEPENGDSTSVTLQYNFENNSRDYTLSLSGTQNIKLNKLNIQRQNGQIALLLSEKVNGLDIKSCRIGNITSLENGCDSNISISKNALGYLALNGNLNSLGLSIRQNLISIASLNGGRLKGISLKNFKNASIFGNSINVSSKQDFTGFNADAIGMDIVNCNGLQVASNLIKCNSRSVIGNRINQSIGFQVANSVFTQFIQNSISLTGLSGFAMVTGIITDTSSNNLISDGNDFILSANGAASTGGGTSITGIKIKARKCVIKSNIIRLSSINSAPVNLGFESIADSTLISSNIISNSLSGIRITGNGIRIIKNNISTVNGIGIDLANGLGNEVLQNRVTKITNGIACWVRTSNSLIANNFFQTEGSGLSHGILLDSNAFNSKIYFNSINATGTDVFKNSAFVLKASSGSKIQNNIFSCSDAGSSITVLNPGSGIVWSNNCYYSPSNYLLSLNASAVYWLPNLITALGQNSGSISTNPYFNSLDDLSVNQIILNDAAIDIPEIVVDILDSSRGNNPDIGAKEFDPCGYDAGVDRFVGLESPISSGLQPIKILLRNHGINPITNLTIQWSVNGVSQSPFQWNGQLVSGTLEVQIGSYNFIPGVPCKLLAYSVFQNDCNSKNDSIRSGSIASALCGSYTIGGTNSDFSTFTEAVSILTVAGITCPVNFKVANGVYDEQIQLGEIQGSSLINTITFESLSGDSSKSILEYTGISTERDFSLNLRGTDYLNLKNIGVKRTNGNNAILLSDGNHNINFQSCVLGNIFSTGSQVDSSINIANNNSGFIYLNGNQNLSSNKISVVNNKITSDIVGYSNHFGVFISYSSSPLIERNSIYINSKSAISSSTCQTQIACGIGISNSPNAMVQKNYARAGSSFYYGRCSHDAIGLKVGNCVNAIIKKNQFLVESYSSKANTKAALLEGSNANFVLDSNSFSLASTIGQVNETRVVNGILNTSNQSGKITNNQLILGANVEPGMTGIQTSGDSVDIYNNTLSNFNTGIESKCTNARIIKNRIFGIFGNGISLLAGANQVVSRNRILNVTGNGIVIETPNSLTYNNYINVLGNTPSRGIWVKSPATGSRIYFNSVLAKGTDLVSSLALEVESGIGSELKNNIFSNFGSGQAVRVSNLSSNRVWNHNCYFSKNAALFLNSSQSLSSLSEVQTVLGQDANSINVNPYFQSDSVLITCQSLLDNSGMNLAIIQTDIDDQVRNSIPDIGAEEFELCEIDMGINKIVGLQTPISSGFQPINVILQNHGKRTIKSVSILWEVNGISQIPFFWSGSLAGKTEATVQVGNYYFLPGRAYEIKAWTKINDGSLDCNLRNDTSQTGTLVSNLCGVFTIGGNSPDFLSISDAVKALNFTGVSCPVVFKIRNGVYKEQAEIGNIQGSSAINTVTFESESGDSSAVLMEYQTSNANRDFTFGINGTKYLNLYRFGIGRKNGKISLQISGGSHHLSITNSRLGYIYSPNTFTDSAITISGNRCGTIQIQAPSNSRASGIQILNNQIDVSESLTGSSSAVLLGACFKPLVKGNTIKASYLQGSAGSTVISSGIIFSNCQNGIIEDNIVTAISRSQYVNTENIANGLQITQSSKIQVLNNSISAISSQGLAKSIGCSVEGSSVNILIDGNNFSVSSENSVGSSSNQNRGISLIQGSAITVRNNSITPISSTGSGRILFGIFSSASQSEISGNKIIRCGTGIESSGQFSKIFQNRISDIAGTGVKILLGKSQEVFKNKIWGITNGTGLIMQASETSVSNNIIQTKGPGISKGLIVQAGSNNSKILFNSIRIDGTDLDYASALEFQESNGTLIKNNIFANLSNGPAIQIGTIPNQKDWDFNCFYSGGSQFARTANNGYSNITAWGQLISAEVNSKLLQPFFQSDTLLVPNQRQINGAGIPSEGISTDIDGKVRNSLAPDLGAYEFLIDFGLSNLTSPSNSCAKTENEKITLEVNKNGNIPGSNVQLAYQINGGIIIYDTIPGVFDNSIEFTFTQTADLSLEGTYQIKVWLVENQDDNPSNDTLKIKRLSKPVPVVAISNNIGCAQEPVVFNLTTSIPIGEISPLYEWYFGDSDTSIFSTSPAQHIYSRSDTFEVVARAYSLEGCYGEDKKEIILNPTPIAIMEVSDHCFDNQLPLINLSVLENDFATYEWKFGDQTGSTMAEPQKIYSSLGEFEVQLIVTAINSQCRDTVSKTIKVNPLPALSTNLDTAYYENAGFITLAGTPPGGTFIGNGVFENLFNTDFVGLGQTLISYTYGIPGTGCRDTLSQLVTIKEFNFAPSLIFQSTDKDVCAGNPVSLLVQATGTRLKFQWFKDNQVLENDTVPVLNFNPAQVSNSGAYFVRIWNLLDTIQSDNILLKVNALKSRIDSITICPSSSYTLPNGIQANSPGIYVSQFFTSAGCDSTITTILDTSRIIRRNFTATLCNGSVFDFYGQTLTQNGTYSHLVTSGTGCDSLYVLRLNVVIPDTLVQSLSSCKPTFWYGQNIETNGQYYHFVPTQTGSCDSVYQLNFTRTNPPDTSQITVSACGSYQWNGSLYSSSGNYFFNSTTPLGCDSVASLNLTIIPRSDTSITSISNCGPYVWNNLQYSVSGTYFLTFALPSGCDSIARLDLQINLAEDTSRSTVKNCGPYVWNNQVLDSSGTYFFNTFNANGCDSTARLELIIYPKPDTLVENISSCGPFFWNGNLFTQSGSYFIFSLNANGCDSVSRLNLLVLPTRDTSVTAHQNCGPYLWNGNLYQNSGTYFVNFTVPGLCDSLARLDLIIYLIETRDTVKSCGSYFWNNQILTSSGNYQVTNPNALGCDSIAYLNLNVSPVPDTSITVTQSCGPYFWNGETYFNTGIYYYNSLNQNGCDSTAKLNLIVFIPPQVSILSDSSCANYFWNGREYNESGVYDFITQLPNGCDSTARLFLTIIPVSSNETASSCGPYSWNGQLLDSSGTYSITSPNILGCDSVATLQLSIFAVPDTSITNVANCGPYFWNGLIRDNSGIYFFNTTNSNGCDSIANLILTVLPVPDTIQTVDSACGSYNWKNQVLTESGIYLFITPGPQGGCDTVSRLLLTVFPNASSESISVCGEYVWNGQTYNDNGTYTFTSTSANGCDSTATLILTILPQPETDFYEFTRCLPFSWNGFSFDTAGIYELIKPIAGGCDSVFIVTIFNPPPGQDSSVTNLTSCGPLVWNGISRDSSGIYYFTTQNAFGCDSTAQLNLTLLAGPTFISEPVSIGFDEGNSVVLSVQTDPASGNGIGLHWQLDNGAGFTDISSTDPAYLGYDSTSLTILNTPLAFNGYRYRCIAGNGTCSDTSGIAIITEAISKIRSGLSLKVQPNPAHLFLIIRADSRLNGSSFRLIDLRGVEVLSGKIDGNETKIELGGLPPGLYSLLVVSNTGSIAPVKIIVE